MHQSKRRRKHAVYGFGEENGTSRDTNFSDGYALNNLYGNLDSGLYSIVNEAYERIHSQHMQVMALLSKMRKPLSNTSPVKLVNSEVLSGGSKPHNVIDLEGADMRHVNNEYQPIVLDPDRIHVNNEHHPVVLDPDMPTGGNKPPNAIDVEGFARIHLKNEHQPIVLDPDMPSGGYQPHKVIDVEGFARIHVKNEHQPIVLDPDMPSGGYQPHKVIDVDGADAVNGNTRRQTIDLDCNVGGDPLGGKICNVKLNDATDDILAKIELRVKALKSREKQPTIRYEKVSLSPAFQSESLVLVNVNKRQPVQHVVGAKHTGNILKHKQEEVVRYPSENSAKGSDRKEIFNSSFVIEDQPLDIPNPAPNSDDLDDLWKDMSLAMEFSRTATLDSSVMQREGDDEEDCDHSFVLQDDVGLVCRVCGIIQKSIDAMIDYQWAKATRTSRNRKCSSYSEEFDEAIECYGHKVSRDPMMAEISLHPRHMKQIKPHQLEGFNFLVRNLVSQKPGGCILAHAPGSGKTFVLITFIQSFLAKFPDARPLIVLPKGIVPIWKKEFKRWQVEDVPIYDFYSLKADNRLQQLEVLKKWEDTKSILLLGYKQFATIVSNSTTKDLDIACQERLLKVPSLLILDEGHTPRNEDTEILNSLAKVQTPRKVVLSGTLFQNHVKEVFNILNLVRPKFLHMDSSHVIVKRMLSRVKISGGSRTPIKGDKVLDFVEDTLRNDDNYKRKVAVIQDLRELTQNVLHYYKGDFLEELPGSVDFTIFLRPSVKQKRFIQELRKSQRIYKSRFKKNVVGSAVYVHPYLLGIVENASSDRTEIFSDAKFDDIMDSLNVNDGVKTTFFLNILSMSEASGEKVLVFSQYLIPMKFLEKLVVKLKGWRVGKEIFIITGDTSAEDRESYKEQFNNSSDAKLLFGSIKACGEGISLVGASRVVILDVHLNPSVTRQAIGRAFRPGQKKKVYTYRLVCADSQEEEDHQLSFRKDLMSKMWFEWRGYTDDHEFELREVAVTDSGDTFLENPMIAKDVKVLYRR